MFFVGIDWADEKHTIVILDEVPKHIASFEIPHSHDGIKEFTERLKELGIPVDKTNCFIETSRGLLVSALLQQGFTVYPLNPKVVDRQRRPSGAKTDFIDARLLADIGRKEFANLRPLIVSNDLIEELRMLTRDQEGLVHAQTRLTNQLIAFFKGVFSCSTSFFHKDTSVMYIEIFTALPHSRLPGEYV